MHREWGILAVLILFLAIGVTACKKKPPETSELAPPPTASPEATFDDNPLPPYSGPLEGTGPLSFEMKIIYFDYDRYDLKEDALQALKDNAQTLLSNPNARILVQGSCDERGTNEYNLALGEKRGNVARDYLVSLGVDSGRIAVVSLGEEQPICQGHDEDCWWRNRKDEFASQ